MLKVSLLVLECVGGVQATALLIVWTQQGKDVESQYNMTLNQFYSMVVER